MNVAANIETDRMIGRMTSRMGIATVADSSVPV
jgi:hypothetical protein